MFKQEKNMWAAEGPGRCLCVYLGTGDKGTSILESPPATPGLIFAAHLTPRNKGRYVKCRPMCFRKSLAVLMLFGPLVRQVFPFYK